MAWATIVGLGLLALATVGYLLSWHEVHRQRRRLHIVTHRQLRRLMWWRAAFLMAVMGALAGMVAALLSRLLVI